MVSDPEHSRSLPIRGPSSVVSSARGSRHRRQGRSHSGGTSYVPQNDFPVFSNTGDVEIIVSAGGQENRYLLHRLILTQCSGFFEASTSQEWSRAAPGTGAELARIGEDSSSESGRPSAASAIPKMRWRYELDTGTSSDDDIPMLVQKEVTAHSVFGQPPAVRNKPQPPASSASFFRSVTSLALAPPPRLSPDDEDLLRDYNNLFLIFYNYAPALSSVSIADAYIQCKTLLSLADMYDALAVVGPRIDHHLLQFQSRLFKQIAKYPASYLKLGYLARSKVIFAEALIHVVGQWPLGERHLRSTLPELVMDLVENKVYDLADLVSRVESRLWRITLYTNRGERISPSSNFIDWLAVSLFRDWLAENTSSLSVPGAPKPPDRQHARHSQPPPPYSSSNPSPNSSSSSNAPPPPSSTSAISLSRLGRTCRLLGSSAAQSSCYLNHDTCKRFLKLSGDLYSRDNLRRFERKIEELKAVAREVVSPLTRWGLQLEPGGSVADSITYLTCTSVADGDWVWEQE